MPASGATVNTALILYFRKVLISLAASTSPM